MSVFIFILAILPGNTCLKLPIIQPAPELYGTYNKPVSFNCTIPSTWISTKFMIKGEHGYKFSVFNGHPCEVPLRVRDNYTISCHGNTLTIGILQPVDKTTWQCAYNINPTEEYNASTTLNLQPEIPSVNLQQDTYVITEGSDVTVPCAFIGAPISNVTWQGENNIIQWSKNENHDFNLVLKNVSRNLAGNYTCSVTVDFKGIYTDSKTITLVVKYPPSLMPNNEITVKEYTPKVSIPCRILEDGFPRNYTTVLWQHFVGNTLIRNLTPTDPPPDEINSTFTLVLKSVSFDDSGSYVCAIGNGVTDFEGDLEQTTCVDLVVQGTPKVLRMKDGYHGEIGKQFSIIFRCVGQPVVPTLKINTHNEDTGPMFNISTTRDLVEIAIYGTLLSTNGTIVTMTFGVIKDWFNTTYELIAENSVGVSNHSFFVDSHDFPRTPYHIHFKKFESTALLEWEAGMPDVDKQYEIIVKNISGIMKELNRIQGTDSQVYQYRLTNLVQPSNIIQICTLNHLGRNCSTTFKIKMDTKTGIISQIEANQTPTSLILPLSIGLAALLGVFVVCLIIILRRRKSFSPLKRRDTPFRRNSNEVQRLTLGQENEESFIREASADNTYITPQCMNSRIGLSPSCQSNAECDAYASVDDININKLSQPQGQDFGNSQHAGNIKPKTVTSDNSTKGPTLPERATQASQLRYSGMNGHAQGSGATSIDLPSSPPLFNGSATTCEPNTAISILDVTTGAQGGTENENGGYCEIKHKSNVKYSKKWCENGSHIKKM